MQWLKTWLRKWLGIEDADQQLSRTLTDVVATETETKRLDALFGELSGRVENLREHYATVKEMGDACMARLDRETMKLAHAINSQTDKHAELALRVEFDFKSFRDGIAKELIEIVQLGERDQKRISELETLVKDATLDTALAALEDRVAVIENHPPPPSTQGRRSGSAWNSHQVAAAAGAALANGVPNPIPTPGIS